MISSYEYVIMILNICLDVLENIRMTCVFLGVLVFEIIVHCHGNITFELIVNVFLPHCDEFRGR